MRLQESSELWVILLAAPLLVILGLGAIVSVVVEHHQPARTIAQEQTDNDKYQDSAQHGRDGTSAPAKLFVPVKEEPKSGTNYTDNELQKAEDQKLAERNVRAQEGIRDYTKELANWQFFTVVLVAFTAFLTWKTLHAARTQTKILQAGQFLEHRPWFEIQEAVLLGASANAVTKEVSVGFEFTLKNVGRTLARDVRLADAQDGTMRFQLGAIAYNGEPRSTLKHARVEEVIYGLPDERPAIAPQQTSSFNIHVYFDDVEGLRTAIRGPSKTVFFTMVNVAVEYSDVSSETISPTVRNKCHLQLCGAWHKGEFKKAGVCKVTHYEEAAKTWDGH